MVHQVPRGQSNPPATARARISTVQWYPTTTRATDTRPATIAKPKPVTKNRRRRNRLRYPRTGRCRVFRRQLRFRRRSCACSRRSGERDTDTCRPLALGDVNESGGIDIEGKLFGLWAVLCHLGQRRRLQMSLYSWIPWSFLRRRKKRQEPRNNTTTHRKTSPRVNLSLE